MIRKNPSLKKCQLILFFLALCFLSGCSFKEIEKSAFIAGIGIDPSENSERPYKVSLKIFNQTGTVKDNPEPSYIYVSEEGKSITDAIRLLETKVDKRLEFGHLKIILLGEDAIKELQITDMLDFLMRRPDIQLISWVMVGRPSAEKVLQMVPETETAAYPSLYNYFDLNANESPYIITTYLFEFRRQFLEKGVEPVIPIIEIEQGQFVVDKAIVIGENKTFLELDSLDTKIFNILLNRAVKADLIVEHEDELFMVELDRFNMDYQAVENADGTVTLKITFDAKGLITESKNPLDVENLPKFTEWTEAKATEDGKKFLSKLKEGGFDPIGFGLYYKGSKLHNELMDYDEWKKQYKNAKIEFNINLNLTGTGQLG
ncbi:Ger(x)C family spore germination protein [Ureibacillus acetophenoni]|uniref:Spore germination protein KC n=1 Tax=Ureibacillus acetophenoni TaxID=614649 RepID=A0A285UQI1_9BACL|nr:Ger(x)C family spore germination protein [Ureibacillus acetophenoni]SOC44079.1 spore germination protein KC [Ureibacillus acetophenoni]